MNRRKLIVAGAAVNAAVLATGTAFAFWSVSATTSTQSVPTDTVLPPAAATATGASTTSMTIAVTQVPSTGPTPTSYQVDRTAPSAVSNVCTISTLTAGLGSCTDTGLTTGTSYTYAITSKLGTNWVSANKLTGVTGSTAGSADATAPTQSLSLTAATGAYLNGSTLYFKSNAAGSFRLVDAVTDGGAGPASATFPAMPTTTGWTPLHAAETASSGSGSAPTISYTSTAFTWTSGASTPASYSVTSKDAATPANTSSATSVTFVADTAAPVAANITGTLADQNANVAGLIHQGGGYYIYANATDAGSGIGTVTANVNSNVSGGTGGACKDLSNNTVACTAVPLAAGTYTVNTVGGGTTTFGYRSSVQTANSTLTPSSKAFALAATDNVDNGPTTASPAPSATVDNTRPAVSTVNLAAASPTAAGSVSWTVVYGEAVVGVDASDFSLTSTGLGGTPAITGVTGSGTTYTVTASDGTGSGTLRLNALNTGTVTDEAGNLLSGTTVNGQTYTIDRTPPTVSSVALSNTSGGTAGKVEKDDTITITYSETIAVSSFCSSWSGDSTSQTLSGNNDVTVTLVDGGAAANDSISFASANCPSLDIGTIDLGSKAFATSGDVTYSGSGSGKSSVAWNATTKTLTVTLGTASGTGLGTVSTSGTATYTPGALTDSVGNAISGTGTQSYTSAAKIF